jgi:hypothetical protein
MGVITRQAKIDPYINSQFSCRLLNWEQISTEARGHCRLTHYNRSKNGDAVMDYLQSSPLSATL